MLRPDIESRPPTPQPLGPGHSIRMTGWEQGSRGGVFYAGGTGIEYGDGPAKLVDVSFSSIGDGSLRIETQRPLTVPHRA